MHITHTCMFWFKIYIQLDPLLGGEHSTKDKKLAKEYHIHALRLMCLSTVSEYLPYQCFQMVLLFGCKELYFLFYYVLN